MVTVLSVLFFLKTEEQRQVKIVREINIDALRRNLVLNADSFEASLRTVLAGRDEEGTGPGEEALITRLVEEFQQNLPSLLYSASGEVLHLPEISGAGVIRESIAMSATFPLKEEVWLDWESPEGGEEGFIYLRPLGDSDYIYGSAGSLDTFDALKENLQNEIHRDQVVFTSLLGFLTFLFVCVSTAVMILNFTRRFNLYIETLLDFFARNTTGKQELDSLPLGFTEFRTLAEAAVHMTNEFRENLESRLRAEEERSTILNSVNEGIILMNRQFEIMEVNPAAAGIYRKTRGEMIGRTCYEVLADSSTPCKECDSTLLFAGENSAYNERCGSDGKTYYESYTPVYKDNIIDGVVLIISDITELKRKQMEVEKSEENLRVTLSSIGDAVISTDRNGFITMINSYASELTGWDTVKAVGVNIGLVFSIVHNITGETLDNPVEEVLRTGKKFTESKYQQLVAAGGELLSVSHTASPILDEEEDISGVILVFRDISVENERARQLAQVEFVLENSPEEIYFLDRQGYFFYANRKARETYRLEESEVRHKTIFEADPGSCIEKFREEQNKLLIEGAIQKEFSRQNEGESLQYVDSRAFLITRGGEWLRCVFEHDITERKKMEVQLVQGQKMQAVGQLVGGIAHDFNNLLCGILGYAEVLSKRVEDNPRALKYAKTIFRTASRATNLTSQLLSFSHNKDYILEPMDVHDCINDTVRLLIRSIDKRIIIRREFNSPESVIVGDSSQLQNAFLNLGINARDAMPDGGLLVITTEKVRIGEGDSLFQHDRLAKGEYIDIGFSDSGIGMNVETSTRIFDPFFTTKDIGEGTGLGLAAVYGTVNKHGGDISVRSEEGVGSEFRILLPLNAKSVVEESDAGGGVTSYSDHRGTVLVVDDEVVLSSLLRDFLEEQGFEVLTASNGQVALELYSIYREEIVCVFMDIIMPVMDGYAAMAEIRKINPDSKIIVVTGYSGEESPEKIDASGASAFIKKPYQMINLLNTLNEVLLENPVSRE